MIGIFNKFYADLEVDLSRCGNNNARIAVLDKRFMELAKHVFNGHFDVNGAYEIRPLDIEFYFHQEDGFVKEPQMLLSNSPYSLATKFFSPRGQCYLNCRHKIHVAIVLGQILVSCLCHTITFQFTLQKY